MTTGEKMTTTFAVVFCVIHSFLFSLFSGVLTPIADPVSWRQQTTYPKAHFSYVNQPYPQ